MAEPSQTQTPAHQGQPEPLPPVVSLAEAAHLDPAQAPALLGTGSWDRGRMAIVVPYDPTWPQRFQAASAEILAATDHLFLRLEHIGSTSVPGLARFLAQVETDLARGAWTDPRAGRVGFAEWAGRWQATTTSLRPNTRALHGYLLRRFLLPAFADTALADLDLLAVRSWLAGLEREAVSPNTVAKAYRLLARIMDTAVEAGLVVRNPCSVKGAATERAPEMRVATVAQVAALARRSTPASAPWCWWRPTRGCAGGAGRPAGQAGRPAPWADHRRGAGDRDRRALHLGAAQDRGRPAHRHPAGGGGHRPGRAPGRLRPTRPRWAGVHLRRGWAAAPQQLQPAGLAPSPPGGRPGGASLPRPAAHLGNPVDRGRASTRELMARIGHSSPAAALRYQHVMAGRDAAIAAARTSWSRPQRPWRRARHLHRVARGWHESGNPAAARSAAEPGDGPVTCGYVPGGAEGI
jgi:hypothetical protein